MIWALVVLAATNLGTLGFLSWYVYLEGKAKNKLINSLVAKNSQEFLNHEMADKTQPIKVEPQPNIQEDLQQLADLTDDQFDDNVLINRRPI